MAKKIPEPPAALPGDIVQVTDQSDSWYLALLVVEEARSWGLKAHALLPTAEGVRQAYYRLQHGKYQVVGAAVLVEAEIAKARELAQRTAALLRAERAGKAKRR